MLPAWPATVFGWVHHPGCKNGPAQGISSRRHLRTPAMKSRAALAFVLMIADNTARPEPTIVQRNCPELASQQARCRLWRKWISYAHQLTNLWLCNPRSLGAYFARVSTLREGSSRPLLARSPALTPSDRAAASVPGRDSVRPLLAPWEFVSAGWIFNQDWLARSQSACTLLWRECTDTRPV